MEELKETPRFNYGSKTLDETSSRPKLKYKKKKDKKNSESKKRSKSKSKSPYKSKKSHNPENSQFFLFLRKTFKLRNDYDYEHSELFLESKIQAFEGYPFNFKDTD